MLLYFRGTYMHMYMYIQKFTVFQHQNVHALKSLQKFHVPKLSTRRLYLRLATMFKIIYNDLHFPRGIILPHNSRSRHAKPHLYLQPFAHSESYHISTHSFLKQYLTGTPYLNILLLYSLLLVYFKLNFILLNM